MSQGRRAMFLEGLPVHHVLAMGDYTYLGRGPGTVIFVRDCPLQLY